MNGSLCSNVAIKTKTIRASWYVAWHYFEKIVLTLDHNAALFSQYWTSSFFHCMAQSSDMVSENSYVCYIKQYFLEICLKRLMYSRVFLTVSNATKSEEPNVLFDGESPSFSTISSNVESINNFRITESTLNFELVFDGLWMNPLPTKSKDRLSRPAVS